MGGLGEVVCGRGGGAGEFGMGGPYAFFEFEGYTGAPGALAVACIW